MAKELHLDQQAEREAADIGRKYINSSDVVGDMSRAYGTDLSLVNIHTDGNAAQQARQRGVDAFATGRDVFFAKGVFRTNDPASRGLLAHELSHCLQQGLGGGMGGMTHAVPAGAEQGGLISWFRGLFGTEEPAAEGAQPEEQADQVPEVQEPTQVPGQEGQSPEQQLQEKVTELEGIRRLGGAENSRLHDEVLTRVDDVLRGLRNRFGNDFAENMQMIQTQEQSYQALVEACAAYTARNPISPAGKARKAVVKGIMDLAARDLLGIVNARTELCAMSEEEQSGLTWGEVLSKVRTVRLSVSDYEGLGRAEGGQVSDVRMLTARNAVLQDGGTLDDLKFFKAEDALDVEAGKDKPVLAQYSIALSETLRKFPNLSGKDQNVLREYVDERQKGRRDPKDVEEKISSKGASALAYLKKWASSNQTNVDEILSPSGILKEGGIVNMSRRNVATSRMAGLLGLNHLVARSQTAEIYDEKTGQTIRGNLMDKAKGVKKEVMQDHLKKNHTAGDTAGFSGGFQRDLISVQVLDVLCGQMDRHMGNLFYEMDEQGNLIGVQAIDNDASFGTNVDVVHTEEENRSDRRAYDVEGDQVNMTLPFMDAQLAARIEALTPEMVRYALSDLLKEAETEAAVRRLGLLQIAIKNARAEEENGGRKRFLEREEDWGAETASAMFNLSWTLETEKAEMGKRDHAPRDEMMKVILFDKLKEAGLLTPEDKTPQEAYARLNKKGRDRTEQENRLMDMASGIAAIYYRNRRVKATSANDTYFGRLFKNQGHK